jgi:hypothetical protein
MKVTEFCSCDDDQYDQFLDEFRTSAIQEIRARDVLFTTDATGLFDTFLANIPEHRRQHYDCHACRRFVDTHGGLVAIQNDGEASPIFWRGFNPPLFQQPVTQLFRVVERARVTGIFSSHGAIWGTPSTGPWNHLSVSGVPDYQAKPPDEYGILRRSLAEFPLATIEKALVLLKTDTLYRSEKVTGVAEWLWNLHQRMSKEKNTWRKDNIAWLAVAKAPPGWCHIRSTMIGTLLEDIQSGMTMERVARRFREKMSPIQYQRPTAEVSDGQIDAAEKKIEELGIAKSLRRRFARIEEIPLLWKPKSKSETADESSGVFGHLRPASKRREEIGPPEKDVSLAVFMRDALPMAGRMPYVPTPGPFAALLTAIDPDDPPILQWDNAANRNPVSHYLYHGGSAPSQWQLQQGEPREVTGVTNAPHRWGSAEHFDHHNDFILFILDNCRDMLARGGNGLFPETLKSELHSVRHVIEAHSRRTKTEGEEQASACGLWVNQGGVDRYQHRFYVLSHGIWFQYVITRAE